MSEAFCSWRSASARAKAVDVESIDEPSPPPMAVESSERTSPGVSGWRVGWWEGATAPPPGGGSIIMVLMGVVGGDGRERDREREKEA